MSEIKTDTMAAVTQIDERPELTETEEAQAEAVKAIQEVETPPEVVGEIPVDPDVLGSMEPQERANIVALQQQHQQLVFQLGNLELRKAEIIDQVNMTGNQIQNVYVAIGQRLNIDPKTRWTVMNDGTIRIVPEQPVAVPQPEVDTSEG